MFTTLVLITTATIAQENENSTAILSERLLDAVDKRDFSSVKALLSSNNGQSLVKLPVGLLAAGRAIENSYYNIAHYILAVRHQKMRFKQKENSEVKEKKKSQVKGGFISAKPKFSKPRSRGLSPRVAPIKTKNTLKKKGISYSNSLASSKNLRSDSLNKNEVSNQIDPFDPSNTPPAELPLVK